MAGARRTTIRWARSFPTEISIPVSLYSCSYMRGPVACKKTFSRLCDLRSVSSLLVTSHHSHFYLAVTKRITLVQNDVKNATKVFLHRRISQDTITAYITTLLDTSALIHPVGPLLRHTTIGGASRGKIAGRNTWESGITWLVLRWRRSRRMVCRWQFSRKGSGLSLEVCSENHNDS